MRSIDEKIIDVILKDDKFGPNAEKMLSSLDKLDKSLKFNGAAKGLEDIDKAAKKISLGNMESSLDFISNKFKNMSLVAITALQNIVNKVVDVGARITKSLSLDPIIAGFQEYELKMGAITTILTNTAEKGKTLEDVTAVLNELNEYADQTVYNFGQMTSAIGRFTANGVDLEDSAKAIKGIANIAAGAGSNTNQMNSAMIQLSQSISNNRLMLQDWNSVVNAGMGGPTFQNMLMEAAVAAGELDYRLMMAVKTGEVGFRRLMDMGSTGYKVSFSRETILDALAKAAEDKTLIKAATQVKTLTQLMETMTESVGSSWAQTWEKIFGTRDQAIELFTSISDTFGSMIQKSNDARNSMLDFWNVNGGRDAVISALSSAFRTLMRVIEPIKQAFSDIFPPMTGQRLVELSKRLKDFISSLTVSDQTIENIRRTFRGLFSIVGIGVDIFKGFIKIVGGILNVLLPVGDGLLGITAGVGDFIVALRNATTSGESFAIIFNAIKSVLDTVGSGIETAVKSISKYFGQFRGIDLGPLKIFSKNVGAEFKPMISVTDLLVKSFTTLQSLISKVVPYIIKIGSKLGEAMTKVGGVINKALNFMGFKSISDFLIKLLQGGVLVGVIKFIRSLRDVVSEAGGFMDSIKGILDGVRGSLEAFQTSLQAKTLLTIATAIAILSGALLVLSSIPAQKLIPALTGITFLFAELSGVMLILSHNLGAIKMGAISIQMVGMASAILILSFAMQTLSDIPWNDVIKGTIAIAAFMTMLVVSAKILSANTPSLIKGGVGFVLFSTSIVILTSALEKLSDIDINGIFKGLVGLAGIMLELVLFTKVIGDGAGLIKVGASMVFLGTGLVIISQAVKTLSGLNWEELGKGLTGVAGVLGTFVLVGRLVKPAGVLSLGLSMIPLSVGLGLISIALHTMKSLSWEELAKGLTATAVSLAALTVASKFVNPISMVALSVSLIAASVGLMALGGALKILATISGLDLFKTITAMAFALAILAAAGIAMSAGIVGAAAMVVMAGAMLLLAPALVLLGSMDMAGIGKMLLALLGVFVIFAGATILLTPIAPLMLLVAGAFAVLGLSLYGLGAALTSIAVSLGIFALSGGAGLAVMVEVANALIDLVPRALENVGKGLVLLLNQFTKAVPAMVAIMREFYAGLVELFNEMLPQTTEAIYNFLEQMSKTLLDHVPTMVDNGMALLEGVLAGIGDNIYRVTEESAKVMEEYLRGLATGMPGVAKEAANLISVFAYSLGLHSPQLMDAGAKLIIDMLYALAETIRNRSEEMAAAGREVAIAIVEGLVSGFKDNAEFGGQALHDFAVKMFNEWKDFWGIHSPSTLMADSAEDIIDGLKLGLENGSDDTIATALKIGGDIEDSLSDGISDIEPNSAEIMDNLTNALGMSGFEAGDFAGVNLAEGFGQNKDNLYNEGYKIGQKMTDGVNAGFNPLSIGPISPDVMKPGFWKDAFKNTKSIEKETDALKENTSWLEQYEAEFGKLGKASETAEQTEAKRLSEEQQRYQKSVQNIERKIKYEKLSTQEQIKMYDDLAKSYSHNEDLKFQATDKVYDLQEKLLNEGYDNYVKWLDDRKSYTEVSITEEMDLWRRLGIAYGDNVEIVEKTNKKLFDLEKQRLSRRDEIKKEAKDIAKSYNDAYLSRADAIFSNARFEAEDQKSQVEYIQEIGQQSESISGLKQEISDLTAYKRELRNMDISSSEAAKEEAWADEQLILKKSELKMAEQELAYTKKKSAMSAAQLQIEADKEALQSLKDLYAGRKALEEKGLTGAQISEMSEKQIAAMSKATQDEMAEYLSVWADSQKYAKAIAANEMKETRQEAISNIEVLKKEYSDLAISRTFAEQLYAGMNAEAPAMRLIGSSAGQTLANGVITGLKTTGAALNKAGKEVGKEAAIGIVESLNSVTKLSESGINMSPTITPIVDMTGANEDIDSAFKSKTIGIGGTVGLANQAALSNQNGSIVNNYSNDNRNQSVNVEIINHNYIRSDTDITKINDGLKDVIDRYSRGKGVKVIS